MTYTWKNRITVFFLRKGISHFPSFKPLLSLYPAHALLFIRVKMCTYILH